MNYSSLFTSGLLQLSDYHDHDASPTKRSSRKSFTTMATLSSVENISIASKRSSTKSLSALSLGTVSKPYRSFLSFDLPEISLSGTDSSRSTKRHRRRSAKTITRDDSQNEPEYLISVYPSSSRLSIESAMTVPPSMYRKHDHRSSFYPPSPTRSAWRRRSLPHPKPAPSATLPEPPTFRAALSPLPKLQMSPAMYEPVVTYSAPTTPTLSLRPISTFAPELPFLRPHSPSSSHLTSKSKARSKSRHIPSSSAPASISMSPTDSSDGGLDIQSLRTMSITPSYRRAQHSDALAQLEGRRSKSNPRVARRSSAAPRHTHPSPLGPALVASIESVPTNFMSFLEDDDTDVDGSTLSSPSLSPASRAKWSRTRSNFIDLK